MEGGEVPNTNKADLAALPSTAVRSRQPGSLSPPVQAAHRQCQRRMSLLTVLLFAGCLQSVASNSTTTTVPPLQWLELTDLLGGDKPPPLIDASIGYDETTRRVIVFGGESDAGVAQSQTYLLNLDTLIWSKPTPPNGLTRVPPARTRAVSGVDYAASYRQGFVIVGGQSETGASLSDVWEFDFNNQFWAQVSVSDNNGPKVWGAAGGIDRRVAPVQDVSLPVPNSTFYVAGGFDGHEGQPLSDVWRLHISGTLSSNLPDSVVASWEKVDDIAAMPSNTNVSSTIILNKIVVNGGCATNEDADDDCMVQDTYIIDTETHNVISPDACLPPRRGPALTSNMNSASDSFLSQAFLFLGLGNATEWDDQGGSVKGEVAVLDVNTGTWARILPSGDPGKDGSETFPTPRDGAAVVGYSLALVGGSRATSSDYLVFGGRDATGKTLSDVWLLRSYLGSVSGDDENWSGYGNGDLQTGIDARGSGVTVRYIPECASHLSTPTTSSTTTSSSPTATGIPSDPSIPQATSSYNTSPTHKILAPLSVALVLPAVALLRSQSSPHTHLSRFNAMSWISICVFAGAYILGIAGLSTSFTTISMQQDIEKRDIGNSVTHLDTVHGQVGLAFFIGMYGILPLIALKWLYTNEIKQTSTLDSAAAVEKDVGGHRSGSAPGFPWANNSATLTSHPPQTPSQKWSFWRSSEGRISPDSASTHSTTPAPSRPSFQVTNRPSRQRHEPVSIPEHPAELSQMSWLSRRRSLNNVGELDYVLTQALKDRATPNTPNTTDLLVANKRTATFASTIPTPLDICIHLLFHIFLLGLCVLALAIMWTRGPRGAFAVLLVWIILFYSIIIILSWNRRPSYSILTAVLSRFSPRAATVAQPLSKNASPLQPQAVLPISSSGPYTHHRPPFQVSHSLGHDTFSHEGFRSVEDDHDNDDDDEVDDDERQQRMEAEMARRDVSILTVPRRKLWVANPSSQI